MNTSEANCSDTLRFCAICIKLAHLSLIFFKLREMVDGVTLHLIANVEFFCDTTNEYFAYAC
ncbi:hypothetical protein P9299_29940 [Bacillus cereus]|uniref:hypothetical protein n=1 Tax=Bacillus thuringiensis TaxID=1428 RepID=UPI00211DA0CC|nr:hypothetical protein [Bacillus thuringiensis]MED4447223.1 hypothetical protein [Bacillus cereus]